MKTCTDEYQLMCEYCESYIDRNDVTRSGFNCPEAIRLVGKSDFYCCLNESNGLRYCCNDRTKSLNFSDMTYGQEAFMLYWPFLAMGGLIAGFVIFIPYTMPRDSEVKHDSPMD
ncbi:protein shisa-1-like isoform X2 [Mercenaria mercenaria]|uniref:protein shisa-1-like isoform X2 n=1 Tax=Mercenaria mercenaria TaxID=6596 RepID=UPI00234EAB4B|nr:protein shisa-1-like isoform X2 [Mercenaria mercenaria]